MSMTSLRTQTLGGLAAAMLLSCAAPAVAGDLSNRAPGGIKDYGGGGVPVPVPMPYEETFKWYVRGDIGTAVKSSGKIDTWSAIGAPPEVSQPKDWTALSILSFGFGRYITPSLRTEFTLDYRPQRTIHSGTRQLPDVVLSARVADSAATIGGVSVPVINVQSNQYHTKVDELTQYQNSTLLMSAFYDFNREGRFKPYVGAGIGLARHELTRQGNTTYTCFDGYLTSTPVGFGAATVATGCTAVVGPPALDLIVKSKAATTSTGWGLAAQVSAGVTYDLSSRTHWDTGYRMLWQSGNVTAASVDGLNRIKIGDRIDHELRTGLRIDIW